MKWAARIAIGLGLLVGVVALTAFANWQGWFTRSVEPAELAGRLTSHMRLHVPEGDGPFPTVLMFHGCGSARASQDAWAAFFVDHGYAALIVDSLGPRGIEREEAITTVCTALQLTSIERAGDVLASLHMASGMNLVDGNNIYLAGWSHGGWAIMDLMAMDLSIEAPPNLNDATADVLDNVRGAVLIYPYCGFPSRSLDEGWQTAVPTLMLMGEDDTIAPANECLPIAERLQADGVDVRTIVYKDAGHDFDVSRHERFHRGTFAPEVTRAARAEAITFMENRLRPERP